MNRAYRDRDVVAEMEHSGSLLRAYLTEEIVAAGLQDHVKVLGRPSCLVFVTCDAARQPSQAYRALFMQELLRHGVLGQSFVISAAHTATDIDCTVSAVAQALTVYGRAIEAGGTEGLLVGRPVAPALREYAAPRQVRTHGGSFT